MTPVRRNPSDAFFTKGGSMEEIDIKIIEAIKKLSGRHYSLEAYSKAAKAALEYASTIGVKACIACLGSDGRLDFFYRGEGALPVSIDLSQKKAYTAYALRMTTLELKELTKEDKPLYQLESSMNDITTVGGGIPVYNEFGEVRGAVGVSGAADPKDDHRIAEVFIKELNV